MNLLWENLFENIYDKTLKKKRWNVYFIQFVIFCICRFYFLSDFDQNIDSFPLIWIKLLVLYFPSNSNLIVENIQISFKNSSDLIKIILNIIRFKGAVSLVLNILRFKGTVSLILNIIRFKGTVSLILNIIRFKGTDSLV